MKYFLKRILYGVLSRKKWFPLALFPAVVFLFVSAVKADRYTVSQEVSFASRELTPSTVHSRFSVLPFTERDEGEYPILSANEERKVFFRLSQPSTVEVVYVGQDPRNGTDLVQLYVGRLRKSSGLVEVSLADDSRGSVSPLTVTEIRAVWRNERFVPLMQYLGVGVLAVLIGLVALEFSDDSLKSGRKAARYLNVPMLGTLPNMNRLVSVLGEKKNARTE